MVNVVCGELAPFCKVFCAFFCINLLWKLFFSIVHTENNIGPLQHCQLADLVRAHL